MCSLALCVNLVPARPPTYANHVPFFDTATAFARTPNASFALGCEPHRAKNLAASVTHLLHVDAMVCEQLVTLLGTQFDPSLP